MEIEYAIRDEQGAFFGLPVRTWDTREAADNGFAMLRATRERLQKEAVAAHAELQVGTWDNETASRQRDLEEAVERWRREGPRQWQLVTRIVSPWRSVDVLVEHRETPTIKEWARNGTVATARLVAELEQSLVWFYTDGKPL